MKKIATLIFALSFGMISCSSKKAEAQYENKPPVDYKNTYLIITDQSQNRIARVDLKTQAIVWEWKALTGWLKDVQSKMGV